MRTLSTRALLAVLAVMALACTACATTAAGSKAGASASTAGSSPGNSPGEAKPPAAIAARPKSPALATDPDPSADRCTGYSLDGVSIGMSLSRAEELVSLAQIPPPPPPPAAAHTDETSKSRAAPAANTSSGSAPPSNRYSFMALRLGRKDEVELDFDTFGKDPALVSLRARIFVAPTDTWPASLFRLLGSPKRAKLDEWVWWDTACGYTLRLTRVDALGTGKAQPYILELRHVTLPF
jgi:hypothetical protein